MKPNAPRSTTPALRVESLETRDVPNAAYHSLAGGNFSQDWSNPGLITAFDNWNSVPSVIGYRGDGLTAAPGTDVRTVLAPGVAAGDTPAGVVNVSPDQSNPDTFVAGGVIEFDGIANPTVAIQGSSKASAPFLLLHLDTTGRRNVQLAFNVRDLDGSANDATQQVAVQYRIGDTGNFINVPNGYVADATDPNAATKVTAVRVTLPGEAYNQGRVQVRILTTNADGNNEAVGIDDIAVTSDALPAQALTFTLNQPSSSLVVSGDALGASIAQQGPGSLTASYSGKVQVVVDPATNAISFVGTGTDLAAAVSGNWSPRTAGAAGTDPANYGGRINLGFGGIDLAVRNLLASISTTVPLNLSAAGATQTFASTQSFSLTGGSIDYLGTGFAAGVVKPGSSSLSGQTATNTSGTAGTLVDNGNGTLTLTLPVAISITQQVSGQNATFNLNGTLTGTASPVVLDLNGANPGRDTLASVTEGTGRDITSNAVTITGATGNIVGAKVRVANPLDGVFDQLGIPNFTNDFGALGLTSSVTPDGVLTVSGSAPASVYEQVLGNVFYANTSETPHTANRLIEFSVTLADGTTSTVQTAVVTIAEVNDAPVVTTQNASPTTPQDTPLTFSSAAGTAVTVTDPDAGTNPVQVQITATNGTLTLSGTNGLTFSNGDGTGDASLTFTGTLTNINAALNGLVFTPSAGVSGPAAINFTVNDQGNTGGPAQSGTAQVNVTVQDANDAPTLNGANDFGAISEDDTTNTGTLVSALVAGKVTDPDAGALGGIAVTATNTVNGTWEFALDGTTFEPVGAVSGSAALLLAADATTRVRFVPATNFNGTVTGGITFRAWDRTTGTAGSTANATAAGGTTAFSAATASSGITVNAVNDAPVAVNDTATVDEDASATTIDVLANDSDVESAPVITAVTQGSAGGTITFTAGQVTYTPAANFNGTETFTYTVSDGVLTATATVTVTVNAVNDAPTFNVPATVTVDEDASATTVPGFTSNFVPGPSDEGTQTVLAYVVSNDNNALFSTQPGLDATGKLTFVLAPNANGTATVTVQVQDSGGTLNGGVDTSTAKTFTITVRPVNDAPTFDLVANVTANEDAGAQSVAGVASNFSPGPANESGQQSSGYAVNNDNNALFSVQPTIDATGKLTFTPALNASGTATVTVIAADNGGTANGGVNSTTKTFTITINPVNDAPNFDLPANVTVNEDAAAFSQAGFTSNFIPGPGNEGTQTVLGYVVSNNNNALFSTQPGIAPDGTLTFTLAPDANGTATVTVQVRDSGGTLNGGVDTSTAKTFTITANAVNDAPTVTLAVTAVSVNQDSGPFTQNEFAAFAPGGGADETAQTVQSYTVTNSNNALFATQPGLDATGKLTFTPAPGASGTATVTVTVTDSGGTANGGTAAGTAKTFTVNVIPPIVSVAPPPVDDPVTPTNTVVTAQLIAIGTDAGPVATVRLLNPSTRAPLGEFVPFAGFTGGVQVALGDVNGDGRDDIIVATASGVGHVKVFDGATGVEIRSFLPFGSFPSGLNVAVGDVDGDGKADIVVGVANGPAHVKVISGATGAEIRSFIAFEGFLGGVKVSAGDMNGDGKADIAAVAGPGGNGHIKVFDSVTGTLITSYLSYVGYLGEVNLAVGDTNGDGLNEVVTTALNPTRGTHIRSVGLGGTVVRSLFAPTVANSAPIQATKPARVGVANIDADGFADILLGSPTGAGGSTLLVVNSATGQPLDDVFAFDPLFGFGVYVA